MEITVHYFTVLRELTKKRQEKIKLKEGSTVEELFALLTESYGARFKRHVFPPKAKKGLQLVLLLNNQDISQLSGFKTTLHDGDIISLILPIAGG
jgi:MoaD family protein